MESEITPVQPPQKPFYKRPWGFIAIVAATPVVVVALLFAYIVGGYYLNYFIDASKLPPEARWLLEHKSEQQRIEDMVENAEKYRKLPCAEVQILEDTYCFDRSRMGNMHIYTSRPNEEFYAFRFSFISEILPNNKTAIGYENAIKWVALRKANSKYDIIAKNGIALSIPHRMVYNSVVDFREDEMERSKYEKVYRELLKNNNNNLVDFTPLLRQKLGSIHYDERVFNEDNIPVAIVDLDTGERVKWMDGGWKYTGKISPYAPAWQPFYLEFGFQATHGASRDEVRLKYIRVAKEIWQFLEDSKLH